MLSIELCGEERGGSALLGAGGEQDSGFVFEKIRRKYAVWKHSAGVRKVSSETGKHVL